MTYIKQALLNNNRVLERLKVDITKYTVADYDETNILIEVIKDRLNEG